MSNVFSLSFQQQKIVVIMLFMVSGVSFLSGCQRRAYTDLYVERMAGEIRELEDRIFEYDAAYRQTEDELDIIRSENAALRDKLTARTNNQKSIIQGQLKELRDAPSLKDLRNGTANDKGTAEKTIVPVPDPNADAVPIEPQLKSITPTSPTDKPLKDLEPPEIELGFPSTIESLPFKAPGGNPLPNSKTPQSIVLPPLTSTPSTGNRPDNESQERLVSRRLSHISSVADTPSVALPTSMDQDVVASNQIVLPESVITASATVSAGSPTTVVTAGVVEQRRDSSTTVIGRPQWIPQPTDMRVVEIGFHPTLCRGGNRESSSIDDGLQLVMQPMNQYGEFIAEAARMTVVVIDLARPDSESKIGRWVWDAEELQQSLQPIGMSQGFNVAIAWQAERPLGRSVRVHVRYEMADGRRLVNQKEIELYSPSLGSDAWTPRVPR